MLTYSSTGTLGGVSNGRFRLKGRPGSQSAAFSITATNGCGSVSTSSVAWFPDCGYRYEAYPNPADDQLTVAQTDSTGTQRTTTARSTAANSSTAPGPPYTVRFFDSYGVQQAQQATTTPTLSLPTGALPTGLYLLHIRGQRRSSGAPPPSNHALARGLVRKKLVLWGAGFLRCDGSLNAWVGTLGR